MTRLAGLRDLLRLAWRRDRVIVPSSVAGLVLLSVGSAQATLALFPDDDSAVAGLADIVANPALVAMYGPISAADADALAVFKTVMMGAVLTAVLALVVLRRHTRTEEEEGRLELVGAGVVGRWAPLAAGVLVATSAVLLASGLSALGLLGLGMDPAGSLAFGVAWATAGLAQVGVTALAVQLASTTRGAGGLAFGALGAAYLLRAAADSVDGGVVHALGWLSPLGWAGRVEPYGRDRTWVLALGLGALVLGVAAALVVLDRRDLGGGVLPTRTGRARAGRALSGPLGLVSRLATGTLLGWVVGLAAGGVVLGSLLGAVGDLSSSPQMQRFLEALGGSAGTLEEVYLATESRFVAVAIAAGGIALVLRLGAAERLGLGEAVLATPTSRTRWYAAHVALAVGATTLFTLVVGGAVALVGPRASEDAPGAGAVLGAFLATLPAVWLLVAAAALLVGARPRFAPLAWAVLLVGFVVGELGPTMDLPGWLVDLSPFAHLGQLPGGEFAALAAAVMTVLAAGLVGGGGVAYARRDLA
ncbi:polyketide antibiotic transporter [Phycicoccus endophyticus]|uniref:Polyketide antibiotic transporter n=1 Tax=Phycicoccus endophyticus TaxID=1690220 RepID=A0A7G9R2V8_9MICO|nr:polyketide antibiotic transporter [Phycicoccus endophyticus]NHI20405.1 polyketide antibiotic transporter [Phycicoccus endophyticus]QNN49933.1 polyketide antibiotic transporter [Phycicoccus endophyticus]GGL29484.1 tetronasin ABC transporter integral membrane protein [Phycicoccus endophyticus]